jgi:hypothetical protein
MNLVAEAVLFCALLRLMAMRFAFTALICFCSLVFLPVSVQSQSGGKTVFRFLETVPSAYLSAMGGAAPCAKGDDATLGWATPSLLHAGMGGQVSINQVNYLADANFGFTGYTHDFGSMGTGFAAIQYFNYGKFVRTDEAAQVQGDFKAADYALVTGWGKAINPVITVGGSYKFIYSVIEGYSALGMAVDLAGTYVRPDQRLVVTVALRNAGVQLKEYMSGERGNLPINLTAGISYRPEHVPVRLSLTLDQLQRWDLAFRDTTLYPNRDPNTGQILEYANPWAENLFRHFTFGGEFLLSKSFQIRLGYNYRRRQELGLDTRGGLAGFSLGAGLKLYKFQLSYAWSQYHFFGASHHFSIAFRLQDFKRRTTKG